ncbi:MaoC family dehydratase [Pseudalkalibacillus sp. A8]|uniref:MaoC family dehydratase n=1 Tax=Pseudalkalibacillus sp. A8 TaxID=3382641 RepID=UPI0038B4F0FB
MSRGKYFEEFSVGDIYPHRPSRTVTETDNLLFTTLTHNTQSLHLDEEYSKKTIFGGIIVNSLFTLSFVVGVSVGDLTEGTTLGNLGFDETTFPAPVRVGDTIRAETEIVGKRESKSRHDSGIIWFEHRGYNQTGELVVKTKRAGLILRKSVEISS